MGRARVYYRLHEAQAAPVPDPDQAYLIAEEIRRRDGQISRCYRVFDHVHLFLRHRDQFPHAHELLVQHEEAALDTHGRLVFDFDLPLEIPNGFTRHVEDVIQDTLTGNWGGVQPPAAEDYVWSQSPSTAKTSLHLTVKNICWWDWITGCRVFYALFMELWDERYDYLKAEQVVDQQVIRRHGSLRMVGSSKIGGEPLVFLNRHCKGGKKGPLHTLTDSLIRVVLPEEREREQMISLERLSEEAEAHLARLRAPSPTRPRRRLCQGPRAPAAPLSEVWRAAWALCEGLPWASQYYPDQVVGDHLQLRRACSGACPISGRRHDSDNAYLVMADKEGVCRVRFRCWRGCRSEEGLSSLTLGRVEGSLEN